MVTQTEKIQHSAARMLGSEVASFEAIGGGRNSRVYRLACTNSQTYALKSYFRHATDNRDRLGTEFSSLQFLWKNGVRDVPRPISANPEQAYAVYEYIDGQRFSATEVSSDDLEAAVLFLARLKELNDRDDSHGFADASEACFSGAAIVENIQRRLNVLSDPSNGVVDQNLAQFLNDEFVPAFEAILRWSRERLNRTGRAFENKLDFGERTLSPSDFGFHNALRRGPNQIVFVDFEYFGWDDPAKTVVDFLLHPALELTAELKRKFVSDMIRCFADQPQLAQRIEAVYPLFGLKWCLILLNEFLPQHLQRRRFAGDRNDQHKLQMVQLSKGKSMLSRVKEEYEDFPYFN